MIEYLFGFILTIGTLGFKKMANKKLANFFSLLVPLLFLFLLMVFRDYESTRSVGRDLNGYYEIFKSDFDIKFSIKEEFGFYVVFKLFKSIGSFRLFLAFEYFIVFGSIFLLFYLYSDYVQVSLLTLLFSPLFGIFGSALRQAFGIAFCIIAAICYFKIKSKFKILFSLFFWLLSITFHVSMISFGLFYIFIFVKISSKKILLYLGFFLLIMVSSKYILFFANNIAYLPYGSSGYFLGLPKIAVLYASIFIILLLFVDTNILITRVKLLDRFDLSEKNKLKKMLSLFSLYVIISFTTAYSSIYARFGFVFYVPLFLILPTFFAHIRTKKIKIICFTCFCLVSCFAFWYEYVYFNELWMTPFKWSFTL